MDKQSPNIRLDHLRLLQDGPGLAGRRAFYFTMLVLGGLGAFGCVITAFHIPVKTGILMLAGLLCCGFWIWRQTDQAKRWWSPSLLCWILWLLFVVFLFDDVLRGALRSANLMLRAYGGRLNYELPVLSLPGMKETYKRAEECTAFFGVLLFPFSWWLSRMLVKRKSSLGPFCLTAVFLLLPMGFSILPAAWAYGGILLFWGVLALTALPLGGRDAVAFRRGRFQANSGAEARLLWVPLLVLAGLLAVRQLAPPETYSRPELVNQLRMGVEEGFGISAAMRGGQGNGNNNVELNSLGGRSYSGETMLRVKFDWDGEADTQKEYLKSFVGSVYTGTSWERLSPEDSRSLEEIGLQAQTLPAQYRRDMNVSNIDQPGSFHLSVENMGANPRCVYIPYGLEADGDLSAYGVQLVDDGFAKSGNIFTGSKSYQLDGAARPWGWTYVDRIVRYVAGRFAFQMPLEIFSPDYVEDQGVFYPGGAGGQGAEEQLEKRAEEADSFAQRMLESAGVVSQEEWYPLYFTDGENVMYTANGFYSWSERFADDLMAQVDQWDPVGEWDRMKLPDWVMEGMEPEAAALAEAVENYTDFVYEHYTQVPEELDEFLDRYREAFELEPSMTETVPSLQISLIAGNLLPCRDNPLFLAGKIAQVFRDYYTYSLNPPQPPAGTDFVEYFLDHSHQGYCVHFATAAVMLLRSAGYPARYAEGYVAPSGEPGWTDVPDYNAHAWVEVYCAGSGWLPVEVTPPSPDAPAVYTNARAPENAGSTVPVPQPEELMPTLPPRDVNRRDPTRAQEPSSAPQASAGPSASPAPGGRAPSGRKGLPSAALPAALSLTVVAAVLLLNRALRRWARNRALSQPDRNQAALKAYAYLMKLHSWESLCGEREDPPPRWQELAEKARYGRGMLAQEELDELTGEARRVAEKLRRQLPKLQKARCWLTGLI